MNKGDKVRIKAGSDRLWDGFEAEVFSLSERLGPWLKPLSDRPDGYARSKFSWTASQLELIPEETTFKVGDRVKILASETQFLSGTIGRLGTILAVDGPSSFRVDVDNYAYHQSGSVWYYNEKELELVIEEKQTIEVGDTVKATHAESGSVVQGVASYVRRNNDDLPTNIEIEVNLNTSGTLELYTYQGWEFELVAKKEVPKPKPKVGDVVEDAVSLPVGTVTREQDSSGPYFRTVEGWVDRSGSVFSAPDYVNGTIIVYLPPTDSE